MDNSQKKNLKKLMTTEFYLLLFLILVLLFLAVFAKGFYDLSNLMNLLNRFNYVLIAAVGMN